jgi:hypothetical protein
VSDSGSEINSCSVCLSSVSCVIWVCLVHFEYIIVSSLIFWRINSSRFGLSIVSGRSISVSLVGSFERRSAIVCRSAFCRL